MIKQLGRALNARLNRVWGRIKLQSRFRKGKSGMLFIIGHMRTGSTLLVHILCNNPEIAGYGETHYVYSKRSDIYASAMKIYKKMDANPRDSYALDKVVHRKLIKHDRILRQPAVQVVFLIRSPAESLSSMLEVEVVPSIESAIEHYKGQLAWISRLTSQIEFKNTAFLTYNDMINNTDRALTGLRNFLDLKNALSSEYDTMESTDVYGVGDPGPHIHAEKVKKDTGRTIDSRVEPYLPETRDLFKNCVQELTESCTELVS